MGKIAFVFSGQGDQYSGMGKELYENNATAKNIFDLCDEICPGVTFRCFYGTEEELQETMNTQPCLFAMELAAARVLMEKGIVPYAVAGFSLGEIVAATVSGLFDTATGFRLVCKRGELMQRESEKFDTSMAAVLRLSSEKVQEICTRYSDVYPVNFNCPGQITVSGFSAQIAAFCSDVKSAGGRTIPVKVKGAFHSPFMRDAASAFADEISKVEIHAKTVDLYSNITGETYTNDVINLLSNQICNSVQWEKLIRNMINDGIDTFIEIGPGKTLTNLIRRISTDVTALGYAECIAEGKAC